MVFITKTIDRIYSKFINLPLLFKLSLFFLCFLSFKMIIENKNVNYSIIEGMTVTENSNKIDKIQKDITSLKEVLTGGVRKSMVCEATTNLPDDESPLLNNVVSSDSKPDPIKYWIYLYVFLGIVGAALLGGLGYYIANKVFNKIEEA